METYLHLPLLECGGVFPIWEATLETETGLCPGKCHTILAITWVLCG